MMGPLQWQRRGAARVLCGLLLGFAAFMAGAQDAQEINRLIRLGQLDAASTRADALLAKNPQDPQARFVKGVVLSEQGKSGEAIAVFQSLTEDYPELPEPYNNLASLFAANGQYEKARTALEMAIQISPSYATAYENLGDVHARMASQAYERVLQLDKTNAAARVKLTSIRNALSAGAKTPAATPAVPAAPARGQAPKPAASEASGWQIAQEWILP
jgi:tetratricopeptide (TPR) repeat protein